MSHPTWCVVREAHNPEDCKRRVSGDLQVYMKQNLVATHETAQRVHVQAYGLDVEIVTDNIRQGLTIRIEGKTQDNEWSGAAVLIPEGHFAPNQLKLTVVAREARPGGGYD